MEFVGTYLWLTYEHFHFFHSFKSNRKPHFSSLTHIHVLVSCCGASCSSCHSLTRMRLGSRLPKTLSITTYQSVSNNTRIWYQLWAPFPLLNLTKRMPTCNKSAPVLLERALLKRRSRSVVAPQFYPQESVEDSLLNIPSPLRLKAAFFVLFFYCSLQRCFLLMLLIQTVEEELANHMKSWKLSIKRPRPPHLCTDLLLYIL